MYMDIIIDMRITSLESEVSKVKMQPCRTVLIRAPKIYLIINFAVAVKSVKDSFLFLTILHGRKCPDFYYAFGFAFNWRKKLLGIFAAVVVALLLRYKKLTFKKNKSKLGKSQMTRIFECETFKTTLH